MRKKILRLANVPWNTEKFTPGATERGEKSPDVETQMDIATGLEAQNVKSKSDKGTPVRRLEECIKVITPGVTVDESDLRQPPRRTSSGQTLAAIKRDAHRAGVRKGKRLQSVLGARADDLTDDLSP